MSQPEKAAGKGTTQDRGWRKPADFAGQLNLLVQQKAGKRKAAMVLLMFLVHVQVVEAIGLPMLDTAQPLPGQLCSNWLKQNGCPQRDHFPEKWYHRSQVCCATDPQTVLHCQEPEINGQTVILAACLPDQTIPPGKLGGLILNDTGFLEVDLTTDCAPGTYRTHSINSSFIRYPHCKIKTKDKHAEVMCDGGTTNDDLLICQDGYKSDCFQEHKDHNLCLCYRLRCGKGSQPVRSITGHCNDSSIRVTYNCTAPMSATEGAVSSRIPEESQDSTPVTTAGLMTHSTDNTPTKEQGRSIYGIIGVSVLVIGPVVIISIFCVWCWCQKRAGESRPEKIPYSACSSSGEVEIEILPKYRSH